MQKVKLLWLIIPIVLIAFFISIKSLPPKNVVLNASLGKGYESASELKEESDLVLKGLVTKSLGSYNLAEPGYPYTDFEIQAIEYLKGQGAENLVVAIPGGYDPKTKENYYLFGMDLLEVGKEYYFFLTETKTQHQPGKYYLTGAYS